MEAKTDSGVKESTSQSFTEQVGQSPFAIDSDSINSSAAEEVTIGEGMLTAVFSPDSPSISDVSRDNGSQSVTKGATATPAEGVAPAPTEGITPAVVATATPAEGVMPAPTEGITPAVTSLPLTAEAIEAAKLAAKDMVGEVKASAPSREPQSSEPVAQDKVEQVKDKAHGDEPKEEKENNEQRKGKSQFFGGGNGKTFADFTNSSIQVKSNPKPIKMPPEVEAKRRSLETNVSQLEESLSKFQKTAAESQQELSAEALKAKEKQLHKLSKDIEKQTQNIDLILKKPTAELPGSAKPLLDKTKETLDTVQSVMSPEALKQIGMTGSKLNTGKLAEKITESAKSAMQNAQNLAQSLAKLPSIGRG